MIRRVSSDETICVEEVGKCNEVVGYWVVLGKFGRYQTIVVGE